MLEGKALYCVAGWVRFSSDAPVACSKEVLYLAKSGVAGVRTWMKVLVLSLSLCSLPKYLL